MQLALRDRLSYPAGIAPGFDPSHIASKLVRYSGVVFSGSFVTNILNGSVATTGSGGVSPTPNTKFIGPNIGASGGGNNTANCPPSDIPANVTLAAIVYFDSLAAANHYIFGTGSNGSGTFIVCVGSGSSGNFDIIIPSVATISLGVTLLPNVPYFLVASRNTASAKANAVVVRLDTGQIITGGAATAGTPGITNGVLEICGRQGSQFMTGGLAACMFSTDFLSMQQLLQWAADPWSFWYPQREPEPLKGGSAAAVFLQSVAIVCTTSVAHIKSVGKLVAISCTSALTHIKSISKSVAITCTSAFVHSKRISKIVVVTCSTSLASLKTIGKSVAISCTSAVSQSKQIVKSIAITCSTSFTSLKNIAKSVAIVCTTSTTVIRTKAFIQVINIVCTTSFAHSKRIGKLVTITCTSAVSQSKSIAKQFIIVCNTSFVSLKRISKTIAIDCITSITKFVQKTGGAFVHSPRVLFASAEQRMLSIGASIRKLFVPKE